MEEIKTKTALITGASKGMGRAVAFSLAAEGYGLALCARNMDDLKKLESEILINHPTAKIILKSCDCSIQKNIEELANWVKERVQRLDVLINNVGIYERVSLLKEGDEALKETMQVNLYTPHYLARYFGRIMQEAKKGHIVNITSIASRDPVAAAGSYTVSKYALSGLTKVLREELRESGVKVTEVIPGSTLTASWDGVEVDKEKFVLPEDVAKLIIACLSLSPGANVDEILVRPVKAL